MTIDEFWKVLEDLPRGEGAEDRLEERLMDLSADEVLEFQAHFDRAQARAYTWTLWGAAYIIDGGCSDDGFTDFRYGLISRGREVFESALADPDSLVDVASEDDAEGFIPNETSGYVAGNVYEEKAGAEMPQNSVSHPKDPLGDHWDFDDEASCAQKLPKLWSKFGE